MSNDLMRPVRFAACILGAAVATTGCEKSEMAALESEYPNRRFVEVEWEVVMQAGTASPDDTTFLIPMKIVPWKDALLVADGAHRRLSYVGLDGKLQWTFKRDGSGPGELQGLADVTISPAGLLWAYDSRNAKVMEFEENGRLRREIDMKHLGQVGGLNVIGNRVFAPTNGVENPIRELDPDSFSIISTFPYPWPDSLDPHDHLDVKTSDHGEEAGSVWAMGFSLGPGFMVFEGDKGVAHRYIDPISWSKKVTPEMERAAADSARYGAIATNVVNDEIFMLFGGRPFRYAHPGEPTYLIDVYGTDGQYKRSYKLPVDAHYMFTKDGHTFYVLTELDSMFPVLLGLTPREI